MAAVGGRRTRSGDIMKFSTSAAVALLCAVGFCSSASADVIPPGSFQRTCSDFYTDGRTLSATCRTRWGQQNFTTLRDYHLCRGDIANVGGRLQCVDDDGEWLPRGSYRETCRSERVVENTLTAECVDRNGRWRYTELASYRSCVGDIANANGRLACRRYGDDGGDDDDGQYDLPGGNWRYSCANYRVYGFVLYAHCRDAYGSWRETSIDLNRCRGDVSNLNGRLVCAAQPYGRITLYVRRNYLGGARSFAGDVPDLNVYGFGNLVSSLVVQGGFWELCDRPNYRGHCIVVSRSQSTLYAYGFNDRAESLRRIR